MQRWSPGATPFPPAPGTLPAARAAPSAGLPHNGTLWLRAARGPAASSPGSLAGQHPTPAGTLRGQSPA